MRAYLKLFRGVGSTPFTICNLQTELKFKLRSACTEFITVTAYVVPRAVLPQGMDLLLGLPFLKQLVVVCKPEYLPHG